MKQPKTLKYPGQENGIEGYYVIPPGFVDQVKSGDIPEDAFFTEQYFVPDFEEVEYLKKQENN